MIGPKSMTDEARAVLTEAVQAGWTYQVRSNGHLLLHHPDGVHTATLAASAKHGRGARNARAQIRRYPTPTLEESPMPTVAELATVKPAQEWRPARRGRDESGDPYSWIQVNAAGDVRCTHPGCDWSRAPGPPGMTGLAQHEDKHTGTAHERAVRAAATRRANADGKRAAAGKAQVIDLDDQRLTYARAAVEALAEYVGLKLADRTEVDRLRAQVDDLTAKLALIKEAAGL